MLVLPLCYTHRAHRPARVCMSNLRPAEKPAQGSARPSPQDPPIPPYFRPIATHPGAFDLTDDAAAIAPPPGCDLVLKTDGVISGVHFFLEDPPDAVARTALC